MNEFQVLPSENILKLRKLTEEICNEKLSGDCLIDKLKSTIKKCTEEILSSKTERTKLKHYEKMFSDINAIINEN